MSNPFVDKAKEEMGAIERLLKGLPLIRGYNDKELRRDADRRLRQTLVASLEQEKQRLYDVQKKLLRGGGLMYLDDADGAIQKLQTLIDRIKTASYGYAGLFSAVKIREEQLDALHRFDVALAERTYEIKTAIDRVEDAVASKGQIGDAIEAVADKAAELNRLFDARSQAIEDPAYLAQAPEVEEEWMQAADSYGRDAGSAEAPEGEEKEGFFERIFDRDDE